MKCLVVMACLLVATCTAISPEAIEKYKEELKAVGGECKSELGTSDEDIKPLLKHEPPTTEKGKCFLACIHKKIGFQDASGKIDKEKTMKIIEDEVKPIDEELFEKLKKVAHVCLSEVTDAANECETAAKMFICVKREKEANGVPMVNLEV